MKGYYGTIAKIVYPIQFSTYTFLSKLKWNSVSQKMQDKD